MLTGEDKLQISMTLNDWNTVIAMLAKQPYELCAALIQQIQIQAQQQAQAAQTSQTIPPLGTGSPLNGQMDVKAGEGKVSD